MYTWDGHAWFNTLIMSPITGSEPGVPMFTAAGILYSSVESHYSVFKAARMYRMDAIKVGVTE